MVFTLAEDFPTPDPSRKITAYRVGLGEGVLIKETPENKYVVTNGLRTCVAFSLFSPVDNMALLVHFFSLKQVTENLADLCNAFYENFSSRGDIYCNIVGGRLGFSESEDMVIFLKSFVMKKLVKSSSGLKMRLVAPIVGNEDETLSYELDLSSGSSQIFKHVTGLSPATTIESEMDKLIDAFEPILFSNLLKLNPEKLSNYKP